MNNIINSDVLIGIKTLADESVDCVVTSPPYFGLRQYSAGSLEVGQESAPEEYVARMVEIFREIRRVLKKEGTVWLNIGDSYGGSGKGPSKNCKAQENTSKPYTDNYIKGKDLMLIPFEVARALRNDGWYLRQDIIWHKTNPCPESVLDRCTRAHEYIFLLSKSKKYYYNNEAIKEPAKDWGSRDRSEGKYTSGDVPIKGGAHSGFKNCNFALIGKNRRDVWNIQLKPFRGSHFAVFPPELPEICIKAGCPPNGIVLDPFLGSGTTAMVAKHLGRNYIGIEINPEYVKIAEERIAQGYQIKAKKEKKQKSVQMEFEL